MLTLYKLTPGFYTSARYSEDTESTARIRALGVEVKSSNDPRKLVDYCTAQGYQHKTRKAEIFIGYWVDNAENVYRIV
jgi:hypothetical protein